MMVLHKKLHDVKSYAQMFLVLPKPQINSVIVTLNQWTTATRIYGELKIIGWSTIILEDF